jgi:hypothetical protein
MSALNSAGGGLDVSDFILIWLMHGACQQPNALQPGSYATGAVFNPVRSWPTRAKEAAGHGSRRLDRLS